jgi:hypothetical protein
MKVSELLDLAITAHGGWDRWQRLKQISAHFTASGAVWHVKQQVGAFADARIVIDPHQPRAEYSGWPEAGTKGVWQPQRTAIVSDAGEPIAQRDAPRSAFAGHVLSTPWDAQNALYFAGYALWTYLTTPFLFRLPGFQTEELRAWDENGDTWRRLKVTFPPGVPSHSAEQVFYFNSEGVLQRHDYSVDIMGGTSSCHYVGEHRVLGGILFPTKRRVYSKTPDNKPMLDRVAVSIDIQSIDLS